MTARHDGVPHVNAPWRPWGTWPGARRPTAPCRIGSRHAAPSSERSINRMTEHGRATCKWLCLFLCFLGIPSRSRGESVPYLEVEVAAPLGTEIRTVFASAVQDLPFATPLG